MPLDAAKRAEYQRAYRERQKAVPEAVVEEPFVVAPGVRKVHRDDHGEVLENRLVRQRVGKGWRNPYSDGLPDTPQLIQALTQGQRDSILARMAKS